MCMNVLIYELQLSAGSMKRLALFTDGTHNDTWQCNSYYDAINRFLAEVSCPFLLVLAKSLSKKFCL